MKPRPFHISTSLSRLYISEGLPKRNMPCWKSQGLSFSLSNAKLRAVPIEQSNILPWLPTWHAFSKNVLSFYQSSPGWLPSLRNKPTRLAPFFARAISYIGFQINETAQAHLAGILQPHMNAWQDEGDCLVVYYQHKYVPPIQMPCMPHILLSKNQCKGDTKFLLLYMHWNYLWLLLFLFS